jgi:hypothetical protein
MLRRTVTVRPIRITRKRNTIKEKQKNQPSGEWFGSLLMFSLIIGARYLAFQNIFLAAMQMDGNV